MRSADPLGLPSFTLLQALYLITSSATFLFALETIGSLRSSILAHLDVNLLTSRAATYLGRGLPDQGVLVGWYRCLQRHS